MAKYNVTMSCGHDDVIELFGPHAERKRKIEWFKDYGLCKKCYKEKCEREKQEREKTRARRLEEGSLNIKMSLSPAPNTEWKNNIPVYHLTLWGEDTKTIKDDLKFLGYIWTGDEWDKTIPFTIEGIKSCLDKLSVFCKNLPDAEVFFSEYSKNTLEKASKQHQSWIKYQERVEKAKANRLPKPDILVGKRWNGKIYKNAVYLDGVKVELDANKLEEIKKYIKSKEAYEHKLESYKTTLSIVR